MKSVSLVFPHQLFQNHPALEINRFVYLVEETLFFNQVKFHKQKLVLHRASMKAYAEELSRQNFQVRYVEAISPVADVRNLIAELHEQKVTAVHIADVADDWLRRRMTASCKKYGIAMVEYPTPNFLNTPGGVKAYFDKKKTYFQTDFYVWQRKQRHILVDAGGQPAGGQWSFDAANRLRYPKKHKPPLLTFPPENEHLAEARKYVDIHYTDNVGSAGDFIYPVDHGEAEKWLEEFLLKRFSQFGIYEDAIVASEHFLHHSVLTPVLNIGLLSPGEVIAKALAVAAPQAIPINSLEGFIRQVMGWREFVRIVYERDGRKQRTKNYWGFKRKMPATFWRGETGIVPVDNVIHKVLKTGYSHHIERLMVMGNFMILCEFDPDEVYRWFMEMYVDSYDWVMVPNVYGMTQFADGGLMTTKPYISGSNYLMKMGDYEKGDWTATWDALFWRFMHVHRDFFMKNPRLGMLLKSFDKWPAEKRNHYLATADKYLEKLDNEKAQY
jgi:deoxyribodipyrimidine photolyase-related protein